MKRSIYIPPEGAIPKSTSVNLDSSRSTIPIELMQYDRGMPLLAITISKSGKPYRPPENAEIQLRIKKPDEKYVLCPSLGLDASGTTVYFPVTSQMTAVSGTAEAALEIKSGNDILGIGYIILYIHANPVPMDAIIGEDEIPSWEQLIQKTNDAAERADSIAASLEKKLSAGDFQGEPGPQGEPGKDGAPGKDAQPPVFVQDILIPQTAWDTFKSDSPEEMYLSDTGFSFRAFVEIAGVTDNMVPCAVLSFNDLRNCSMYISSQIRCCRNGIHLYARKKPLSEIKILSIECRKVVS